MLVKTTLNTKRIMVNYMSLKTLRRSQTRPGALTPYELINKLLYFLNSLPLTIFFHGDCLHVLVKRFQVKTFTEPFIIVFV